MDIQFEKTQCRYLDQVLREVREQEQTQEIRLSDGMPDVGRVIAAWGQVVIRSKEWRSDCILVSGGIMAWVLYLPEEGSEPRRLEEWIPFRIKWDLPEGVREGEIRVSCLLRFLDGRSVSPRKIMLRAGISALAEALSPGEAEVYMPGETGADVEILRRSYPVRMATEAGEKAFVLDEELTLPATCPKPEMLVYCTMHPELTERKVMADKAVFRGNGNLHILYRGESGQLFGWDFELPFSQLAQLDGEYSAEAGVDVMMGVTSLEPELDSEGHIRVKCGLVGQYLIHDRKLLELAEDAYSPQRELTVESGELVMPVLLDKKAETIALEQVLPMDAEGIVDCSFWPEHPRGRRSETGTQWELTGMVQALGYGADGQLRAASGRWEGSYSLPGDEDCKVGAVLELMGRPGAVAEEGSVTVTGSTRLSMDVSKKQEFPMITALQPGQPRTLDPGRASLVLKRAGDEELWTLAKRYGTTVSAIRKSNGLQDAPEPGRILLIPVP